jgi:hypothetical protein
VIPVFSQSDQIITASRHLLDGSTTSPDGDDLPRRAEKIIRPKDHVNA